MNVAKYRVSSVELSVVFSVEKNMTLNSTINNTKFFLKHNVLPQSLILLMLGFLLKGQKGLSFIAARAKKGYV